VVFSGCALVQSSASNASAKPLVVSVLTEEERNNLREMEINNHPILLVFLAVFSGVATVT